MKRIIDFTCFFIVNDGYVIIMFSICQVFVKYSADAMLIDAGVEHIVGRRQKNSTKTETDLECFTRIYLGGGYTHENRL
jgi:hypothetical protein